jgi:hypothetical protein
MSAPQAQAGMDHTIVMLLCALGSMSARAAVDELLHVIAHRVASPVANPPSVVKLASWTKAKQYIRGLTPSFWESPAPGFPSLRIPGVRGDPSGNSPSTTRHQLRGRIRGTPWENNLTSPNVAAALAVDTLDLPSFYRSWYLIKEVLGEVPAGVPPDPGNL